MRIRTFLYALLLGMPFFVASCSDDDLKNVDSISSKKITLTRDRTYGVEITYSDSARVKAVGNAPILDKVTPKNGGSYQEMIKGVKISFYNQKGTIDGTLICDYAIRKDSELKTEFRKNVVVKNADGSTFSSEELIWDEARKLFYSNQKVYVKGSDGSIGEGINFEAPQDFSTYKMSTTTGQLNVKEGIAP